MAKHSTSIIGSMGNQPPEIVSVQDGPTTDAPTGVLPTTVLPTNELGKKEAKAKKAAKKKAKKAKKAHTRNDTLGYVVLGGSYALEAIMPNPYLKNSTSIDGHRVVWDVCFALSTAMFLLTLTVQVITWSRIVFKFLRINLDPDYSLGLLRFTTLVIGVNYLIRSQLTHLNGMTWLYIGLVIGLIHGAWLLIWIFVVIPVRKNDHPPTAPISGTGLWASLQRICRRI